MTTRLLTFDEALHLCQAVDFVDDDSWRRILTEAPQRSRGGGALMVVPIVWLSGASAGIAALWTLDAAVLFGVL